MTSCISCSKISPTNNVLHMICHGTAEYDSDNECVDFLLTVLSLLYFVSCMNNGRFCSVFRSLLIQRCVRYILYQGITTTKVLGRSKIWLIQPYHQSSIGVMQHPRDWSDHTNGDSELRVSSSASWIRF